MILRITGQNESSKEVEILRIFEKLWNVWESLKKLYNFLRTFERIKKSYRITGKIYFRSKFWESLKNYEVFENLFENIFIIEK